MTFVNSLYNAYSAYEVIYSALPAPVRAFIALATCLFFFSALYSIFRG